MTATRPAPPGASTPPPVAPRWRWSRSPGPSGDEGAGTILALGLVALLAGVLLACAALGAAVAARHRAAAAADLAALAAADRSLGRSPGPPCEAAAEVAARNGTTLSACRVAADGSVAVVVVTELPAPWRQLGPASARARAGPGGGP